MYVIVIGCGRLGSNLARELSDFGHDVCIIDRDMSRLTTLGSGFNGKRIHGIEFDSDKLAEGGISQAEAILAVSSDDNVNITVSLIANKIYHVPEVIARVNDPNREYIYQKLNIETINPSQFGVEILKNRLTAGSVNVLVDLDKKYEVVEILVGKQVSLSIKEIENNFSCIISGIRRYGEIEIPQKEEVIRFNDRLLCTIRKEDKVQLIKSISKDVLTWNP